jgi:orotate phosphoribosyltransferase
MPDFDGLNPELREMFEVLDDLGGVYQCPVSLTGEYLGRLVGYTATYYDVDGVQRQYVGDTYLNCAVAEQYPYLYDVWTSRILNEVEFLRPDVFMGMPTGGVFVALALARQVGRFIFPDREVTAVKTATSRERSGLVWGRHAINIQEGDRVVVVEDVINNLSTGLQAVELIESRGAIPVGFASLFCYRLIEGPNGLPVIRLQTGAIQQYRQDHPAVAAHVAAGRVAWKPKEVWGDLIDEMRTLNAIEEDKTST